jgi:ssDNA-binding Zn-finger/Zn-ribbon topoisomerase 1
VPSGTNSDELPPLAVGNILPLEDLSVEGGKTKAPPRFTDASLIRYLERKRIGRPSTFASIIKTLFDRDYIKKLKQSLTPTEHGELADRLTRVSFDLLTQEPFTATTEKSLDKIAAGQSARSEFLTKWHVGLTTMLQAAEGHLAAYAQRHPELDRDAVQPHDTPCICGAPRVKRNGKFGEYAQCTSETCGKRQNLAPLAEIDDPCPDCGGAVVEQPYMKEGKKKVFYRCSSCTWKSGFKPPKLTEWPCHVDESHGCMVEVTYMKEGSKKQFLLCTTCQNKAWTGPKPPACPVCSTPAMRLLNGPNGQFWGCSAFKDTACKGVLPFELPAKKKKPGRAKAPKKAAV